jgi:hypothetical protein
VSPDDLNDRLHRQPLADLAAQVVAAGTAHAIEPRTKPFPDSSCLPDLDLNTLTPVLPFLDVLEIGANLLGPAEHPSETEQRAAPDRHCLSRVPSARGRGTRHRPPHGTRFELFAASATRAGWLPHGPSSQHGPDQGHNMDVGKWKQVSGHEISV